MDKQAVIYPYNGILLSHRREKMYRCLCKMQESQNNNDLTHYTVHFQLCEILKKSKLIYSDKKTSGCL